MKIQVPDFADVDRKFKWLHDNKALMIAQKMSEVKHADAFSADLTFLLSGSGGSTVKAMVGEIPADAKAIVVTPVINTTKLMDSHDDVHLDNMWNKSLKENKENFLIKEHNFSFDFVVSDEVKAYVQTMTWKELGYPKFAGETQALIYESIIDSTDKTGMFDLYRKGKVKQHSVGMRYVKLDLAMEMKRYEEERKIWDKYFNLIVNKEEAEKKGYFWAVSEGKNIEGSAVLRGSNFVTPTISVQESKGEPLRGTREEPVKATLDLDKLLNNYQPIKHV